MRASILAILILGGIVLNIKAQFSYNEKGQAICITTFRQRGF